MDNLPANTEAALDELRGMLLRLPLTSVLRIRLAACILVIDREREEEREAKPRESG